ncbi:MAG: copper chaperone PCu(A)C [Alphaproteobacteria bacterium]|nr:copper chaperone PCu(A)C [Alphaproteobacteria bacterium]
MLLRSLTLPLTLMLGALALGAPGADAKTYTLGAIVIENAVAPQTLKGATAGTVYLTIRNKGAETRQLVGVSTPAAAIVELRRAFRDQRGVKTRRMLALNLDPGEKLQIDPENGFEIALVGLAKRLEDGDRFPLTLEFDQIGKVEVTVEVKVPVYSDSPRVRGKGNMHLQ